MFIEQNNNSSFSTTAYEQAGHGFLVRFTAPVEISPVERAINSIKKWLVHCNIHAIIASMSIFCKDGHYYSLQKS